MNTRFFLSTCMFVVTGMIYGAAEPMSAEELKRSASLGELAQLSDLLLKEWLESLPNAELASLAKTSKLLRSLIQPILKKHFKQYWTNKYIENKCFPCGNMNLIRSLSFSSDGNKIAAVTDKYCELFDIPEEEHNKVFGTANVRLMLFSPHDSMLAIGSSGLIELRLFKEIPQFQQWCVGIFKNFSLMNQLLKYRWPESPERDRVELLDTGGVKSIAFSEDEKFFADAYEKVSSYEKDRKYGHVGLWRLGWGAKKLHDWGVISPFIITFSNDNQNILVLTTHYLIDVLNIKTREKRIVRLASSHLGEIYAAAFSPDKKILATSHVNENGEGFIVLWDVDTTKETFGKKIKRIYGSFSQIQSLVFSPDSSILALGFNTGDVSLFDVHSNELVNSFDLSDCCISAIAFSPNGSTLAYGDDKGIEMLRVRKAGI